MIAALIMSGEGCFRFEIVHRLLGQQSGAPWGLIVLPAPGARFLTLIWQGIVMATTGDRIRFTMFYDVRDETLSTSWFYGALDGSVPVITRANFAPIEAKCTAVNNAFKNTMVGNAVCVGFRVDSIDRMDTPFIYIAYGGKATRSGRALPNNCQLNVLFQGRRDPPRPLPRRSTIRSGLRLCGFDVDDQINGRWTQTFFDDILDPFMAPIESDLVIAGDTFVLATGGKGNKFPVDNVIYNEIVGRNITRRANRPQTRKSNGAAR